MKIRLKLFAVLIIMALMLSGCVSKEAKAVIEQIDTLGEITLDSGEEIKVVTDAYENLSEKDKKAVDNYEVLLEKTKVLEELQREEQERIESEARVNAATEAIAKLETMSAETGALIKEAKTLVEGLSSEEKTKVTNLSLLDGVEDTFKAYVEETIKTLMENVETEELLAFVKQLEPEMVEEESDYIRENLNLYGNAICSLQDRSGVVLEGKTKPVLELYKMIGVSETDPYYSFIIKFDAIQQELIDWYLFNEFSEIYDSDVFLFNSQFVNALQNGNKTKAYTAANSMSTLESSAVENCADVDYKYINEYLKAIKDINNAMKFVLSAIEIDDGDSYKTWVGRLKDATREIKNLKEEHTEHLTRKIEFWQEMIDFIDNYFVTSEE